MDRAVWADYPEIFWVGKYRKANRRLALCEAIERRIMADGRMNFTLKYHGAGNTGQTERVGRLEHAESEQGLGRWR